MTASTTATETRENVQPAFVISIHGIRTHAQWQDDLSEVLNEHSIRFKVLKYGYYGLHKFLRRSRNAAKVEEFTRDYNRILRDVGSCLDPNDYRRRPSVIAHSFGTYIVGHAMQKYPDMKFDKLIFCGSILPADFDWSTLIIRDQVNCVLNEYGARDIWAKIVKFGVSNTGNSGYSGFDIASCSVKQERFEYFEHSDYFHKNHMKECWVPFLRRPASSLVVRHGRQIDTKSHFSEMLDKCSLIDSESYSEYSHYTEASLPRGVSLTWIEINPDIYTFLLSRDGEVRGYINAMPLVRETFEKIKAGTMPDNRITADDLVPFDHPGPISLYLCSVAIRDDINNQIQGLYPEGWDKLISAVCDKLTYYLHQGGGRVTELLSVAWTPQGRKICESFGMHPVRNDLFDKPIYWSEFNPNRFRFPRCCSAQKRLTQAYNNAKPR